MNVIIVVFCLQYTKYKNAKRVLKLFEPMLSENTTAKVARVQYLAINNFCNDGNRFASLLNVGPVRCCGPWAQKYPDTETDDGISLIMQQPTLYT